MASQRGKAESLQVRPRRRVKDIKLSEILKAGNIIVSL